MRSLKILQNMEEFFRYSLENLRYWNPKTDMEISMLLAYNMHATLPKIHSRLGVVWEFWKVFRAAISQSTSE